MIRAMHPPQPHPRSKGTGKGEDMTRPGTALAELAMCVTLMTPPISLATELPGDMVVRDVEAAFRGVMELWAYREFWRLWEVSTTESRFAFTQDEFASLMEKGKARPAVGRRIEDLEVSTTSPRTALVVARIGLEDPRTNSTQATIRSFLFFYEDGRWRPQLSDFLGLATYGPPGYPAADPVIVIKPCCPIRKPPPRSKSILKP